MASRGTKVWVAQAAKNPKDGVVGHLVMEEMIWDTVIYGRGWPPVEQEYGGGESFDPIRGRHGGMNQKRSNSIVQSAKHSLSFAILSGCVGARGAEEDAAASQEGGGGSVEELGAIICLKTAHRKTELCVSVSNKLNNVFMNFGFMAKRKCPTIMCIIINYHKIKFIARNTRNWRGPDITMNKFERC